MRGLRRSGFAQQLGCGTGSHRQASGEPQPCGEIAKRGIQVIRQAVSCDICGAEKKQTNHWFVAYEHAGELRVSGWDSRNRLRAGSKHLCGQACLHKLADDFMARVIGGKATRTTEDEMAGTGEPATDSSLLNTTAGAKLHPEWLARTPAAAEAALKASREKPSLLVRMPEHSPAEGHAPCADASLPAPCMNRREGAWRRERERMMRVAERG